MEKILELRYGPASERDYERLFHSYAVIARRIRKSPKTVQSFLSRFRSRGFSFYDKAKESSKKLNAFDIPPDLFDYLVSPENLRKWANLSLKKRLIVIERERNVRLKYWWL